jgi:hypothetical protein
MVMINNKIVQVEAPELEWGAAITRIVTDEDGSMWVSNDEYHTRVNYNPFTGEPAANQIPPSEFKLLLIDNFNKPTKVKKKYYLFTNYFTSSNAERQYEYDYCIKKNIDAGFDGIYLLVENEEDKKNASDKFGIGAFFGADHTPIYIILLYPERRPTFQDYFEFIGQGFFKDSINIVANTDIFFFNMQQIEANLYRLKSGESCFALTRNDFHLNNRGSQLHDVPDSQDTWVFNGNELLDKVKADFSMGIRGCDNRLAYELAEAGFEVLNPSRTIDTYHLHDVPLRTYLENDSPAVPPPYKLLPPTE